MSCSVVRSVMRWKPFSGKARQRRRRSLANLRYTGRVVEKSHRVLQVCVAQIKLAIGRETFPPLRNLCPDVCPWLWTSNPSFETAISVASTGIHLLPDFSLKYGNRTHQVQGMNITQLQSRCNIQQQIVRQRVQTHLLLWLGFRVGFRARTRS
jgi:hypothetical protein